MKTSERQGRLRMKECKEGDSLGQWDETNNDNFDDGLKKMPHSGGYEKSRRFKAWFS